MVNVLFLSEPQIVQLCCLVVVDEVDPGTWLLQSCVLDVSVDVIVNFVLCVKFYR